MMDLRATRRIAAAATVGDAVAIGTTGPTLGVTERAAHSAIVGAAAAACSARAIFVWCYWH
jgi:hypothetical protein